MQSSFEEDFESSDEFEAKKPKAGGAKKGAASAAGKKKKKGKAQKRKLWGTDEDEAIKALVEEHGIKKWTLIAQ